MKKEKKNRVKGIFGTVLFHALLLLLLSLPFMSLTYQDPPPKKGGGSIAINFSSEINTKPVEEKSDETQKNIVTQTTTEALVVKPKKKGLTNKELKFDWDKDGALSDKERKAYEDLQKVNAGLNKVTVTFEGRNPDADLGDLGNGGNGNEYQLGNRIPIVLPKPIYDSEAEGKVVVHIIVDQLGNVIFANPGEKGSTILNKQLLDRAKEAAFKTKYPPKSDAPNQHGKLIYTFQKK